MLLDRGMLKGDFVHAEQRRRRDRRSRRAGDVVWLERTGKSSADMDLKDPRIDDELADALGLEPRDIGMDARELGRSGFLRPAFSNAGLEHFCVPLRDPETLARVKVDDGLLGTLSHEGAYCFTADRPGLVYARGFFPEYGIPEDPATGSGAAAVGVYLAERMGDITFDVRQGVEMGAPSRLFVKASAGSVSVGGRCTLTNG